MHAITFSLGSVSRRRQGLMVDLGFLFLFLLLLLLLYQLDHFLVQMEHKLRSPGIPACLVSHYMAYGMNNATFSDSRTNSKSENRHLVFHENSPN